MKKHLPLKINIPKPCNQDWGAMPAAGNGRHCSQCNNIIYDFSQLSDNELLNFFKQHNNIHCGRFHNSQLHRDIMHTINRKPILLSRFNKVAAAVFAVLSFKSYSSNAQVNSAKPPIAADSNYKYKSQAGTGITTISGIIRKYHGGPLENAKVMLDGKEVAATGKDGKFSFELQPVNLEIEEPNFTSRNIYFSYDSLITAVRTYHTNMYSTSYDVTLYKPGGNISMGIMVPFGEVHIGELPSITFDAKSSKLSLDHKAMLSVIATKLKESPEADIRILAYPASRNGQNLSKLRVKKIKDYLANFEGISAERIKIVFEIGGGDKNIVDIKAIENN